MNQAGKAQGQRTIKHMTDVDESALKLETK